MATANLRLPVLTSHNTLSQHRHLISAVWCKLPLCCIRVHNMLCFSNTSHITCGKSLAGVQAGQWLCSVFHLSHIYQSHVPILQSRTMPQQAASKPFIVPSADGSAQLSGLETAASKLETPTATNSSRLAVIDGQVKIIRDVGSAQQIKSVAGNAAQTVGSSASILCAAAAGAVALIATLG